MTAVRAPALLAFALLCACASSAPEEPRATASLEGRTVRPGCRQGECSWVRVARVETQTSVPEGELRRIVARSGRSTHRGDLPRRAADADIAWESSDSERFVFCSTQRPAFAFPGDGGLIVHFLDLFDLAGFQLSSAALYMTFCHGREALPDEAALRALGYRPGTRNEQVEATGAEEMTRFRPS